MSTKKKENTGVADKEQLRPPKMYRVVIHNDDYTPIHFVVRLIADIFRKPLEEAAALALEVHYSGLSVVGVYSHEVAETKCALALGMVQRHEHPLLVTMEPDE